MPSVSPKQHRFMEAVAHNPGFAKKAGVPQSVGQDFARADDSGGGMATMNPPHTGIHEPMTAWSGPRKNIVKGYKGL